MIDRSNICWVLPMPVERSHPQVDSELAGEEHWPGCSGCLWLPPERLGWGPAAALAYNIQSMIHVWFKYFRHQGFKLSQRIALTNNVHILRQRCPWELFAGNLAHSCCLQGSAWGVTHITQSNCMQINKYILDMKMVHPNKASNYPR